MSTATSEPSALPRSPAPAARYDIIVCGAGSAGCVVAARLAADPCVKVLLLEAGGSDDTELVRNPNLWPRALGTELDWNFRTEPNSQLDGRAIPYGMGRVLGGGSSINVCTWSRGHRADWDGYAAAARDAAWSHANVSELYRHAVEDWQGEQDPLRGQGGPMRVRPTPGRHAFSDALMEAAARLGMPGFPHANGALMQAAAGTAPVDETIDGIQGKGDERRSPYRCYLHPLLGRPNLTVLTGALVSRVLFRGTRATAVRFVHEGDEFEVEAGHEIIVSLGAVHTPKLLMQSGIGDEAALQAAGVTVRHALPGVGVGLHDHVSLGLVWEARGTDGLPSAPRSRTACFWTTDAAAEAPDTFCYARAGNAMTPENAGLIAAPANTWSLMLGLRPHSRGCIRLTGPAHTDPVRIDPNFLADPRDLPTLTEAVGFARALGNSAELRPFTLRQAGPSSSDPGQLERYIRRGLGTFWHQCGTARMGCDPLAVVDGQLRVHGLQGLRVADAAVLPHVTCGNTMAPCVIVGEQAARFVKRELRL